MTQTDFDPRTKSTRVRDSVASGKDSMTAVSNRAPETQITLSVTECRRILIHNWDLLSEKTRGQLQALGVYPRISESPDPSGNEISQNRNI